ncbi:MAG: DNA-packaging protein [Parvularculaceae bacterium]
MGPPAGAAMGPATSLTTSLATSLATRRSRLRRLIALEAAREGGVDLAWRLIARADQRWPGFVPWFADDPRASVHERAWTTWLLLGGRGAGKTRAGAEWIRFVVGGARSPKRRIALVAEAYADAREVMIEGPSGLRHIGLPAARPAFESSRRRLVWPNGSTAYCFSSEDPDGLRGYQFHAAWCDELAKWRHPEETWSNLQLALRLGDAPRQVVTTTPRPMPLLKRLLNADACVVTRASSYANRENLAAAFFEEIASAYEGTRLGRQELLGEIVDDVPGALWSWDLIEAARLSAVPGLARSLDRIVVAVDPPVTSGPDADECGVVVAGAILAENGGRLGYVLDDRSAGGLSPRQWAERAVAAYHDYDADRIVVEVNQGGEMAAAVIAQVDPGAPVRMVRATRGKRLRAEPVASLYERGRVRHVGAFAKLEAQMTSFDGAPSPSSPDRLDALVWALTDLMLGPGAPEPAVRTID